MAEPGTGPGSVELPRTVLVYGTGVAGASAARALLDRGVDVLLTAAAKAEVVAELEALGAVWLDLPSELPGDVDVVVASPGIRPTDPLLVDAAAKGVPVWGEIELAWQLRGVGAAPWLAITGTNGKTTTVHMLESILRSAGRLSSSLSNSRRTPTMSTSPSRWAAS